MSYLNVLENIRSGNIHAKSHIENECFPLIIEAVGKQIAKKPAEKFRRKFSHEFMPKKYVGQDVSEYVCPFCGASIAKDIISYERDKFAKNHIKGYSYTIGEKKCFCDKCGQRLDWGVENSVENVEKHGRA